MSDRIQYISTKTQMVIAQLYSKYGTNWFSFEDFMACFNLSKNQSNEVLGILIHLDIVIIKTTKSNINKYRLSQNKVKKYTDVSE